MLTRFLLLAGLVLLLVAVSPYGGVRSPIRHDSEGGPPQAMYQPLIGRADARAVARQHPAEARAVLDAANDAWDAHCAVYRPETLLVEDLYPWSRRILEARRILASSQKEDIAANLGHWRRMKSRYLMIKALYITGAKGGEAEVLADARYYVAEAEFWLVAAGGTVPEKIDFVTKDTDKSAWQWKDVPTPDEPVLDD